MAVAGSILDNAQTPEMRTYHAGQVARTAAIFNADEIVVFNDKKTEISEGDEVIAVVNGKEFSLMLTSGGNLYFTGNSLAIGHKQPCSPGRWNEVTSKPRRVARMEGQIVVITACNSAHHVLSCIWERYFSDLSSHIVTAVAAGKVNFATKP